MTCEDFIASVSFWAYDDPYQKPLCLQLLRKGLQLVLRIGLESNIRRTEWVEQVKRQIGNSLRGCRSRLSKNLLVCFIAHCKLRRLLG